MVKRSIDQKLCERNFDARHGRIESAAVVENRKGIIGVEGAKGICYQWKEKASVRKETVAVSATKPKIVRKKKTEHTAATPCEPALSRGRGVSKKRSIRGKSNHGCHSFDNRVDII